MLGDKHEKEGFMTSGFFTNFFLLGCFSNQKGAGLNGDGPCIADKPLEKEKNQPMFDKEIYERLESELAGRIRIEKLRSGGHTIRDERGWRENEIKIDYIWLITFDRSFFGKGGILGVKYEENQFREIKNIEKLVKYTFSMNDKGNIESICDEEELANFSHLVQEFKKIDLLEANKGVTLDGITYRMKLVSMNVETTIEVNNPNHESWRNLIRQFWEIGKEMSEKSRDEKLRKLFE